MKKKIILPKDIIMPDYDGGSIVNLMSSIMKASGGRPEYPQLRILKSEELKEYKNILLIVLDGLGYEYLNKYCKNSFLMKNLLGTMTSVFPATTAAAIPTFATGTAPQQHGMTGWYMNVKELGGVITPLRYMPRVGGPTFSALNINPKLLFDQKFFDQKIDYKIRKPYLIQHFEIVNSSFGSVAFSRSRTLAYNNLKGFFQATTMTTKLKGKKYIHAYWPMVDEMMHTHGTRNSKVLKHVRELDKKLEKLSKTLKDTIIIITADHGLIDINDDNTTILRKHPELMSMLSLPLSGDAKTSYCYVHTDNRIEFENYVNKHFKNKCIMLTRKEAVSSGIYGKGEVNPKLMERIGDYVLIWRKNYILRDTLLGQLEFIPKAQHGGASSTEMYVPLIVIKKK